MDINRIRGEFPILGRKVNGKPLIYLDNTATSQTPREVVEAITRMYETTKANVHRGVHTLSQEATDLQEASRRRIQRYINAAAPEEIIFTRGTTEAINLVAASYGQRFRDGDEIILTVMEHHANIVPWQLLKNHADIKLRVVDIRENGELDLEQYRSLFNDRTVMAAFCHVSNVLGTVNPVKEMIATAHAHGVPVLVDGAQASPHLRIDVRDLDCDFYTFSSHKMYGPAGVGVLYVDIAAFDKAIDFIERTGLDNIERQEQELLAYATERLNEIAGLTIYGNAPGKSAVISFNVGNIHNYDLGMLLDGMGVAVRTGHHCAQPLMERLGVTGTVRASFAVYNTREEVDAFISALRRVLAILG